MGCTGYKIEGAAGELFAYFNEGDTPCLCGFCRDSVIDRDSLQALAFLGAAVALADRGNLTIYNVDNVYLPPSLPDSMVEAINSLISGKTGMATSDLARQVVDLLEEGRVDAARELCDDAIDRAEICSPPLSLTNAEVAQVLLWHEESLSRSGQNVMPEEAFLLGERCRRFLGR